jgi:DivIVA domain-containing protein
MAEPLEPQDVARRTFDVARRGYEQQEVRGFLHEVSALLERLSRSEIELRERAERAETRLGKAAHPDEAMLLEVLGEETTRVLTSAREAATEIRSKAEGSVERIVAEATAEAADIRSKAVRDADALVAETKAESESILADAHTELDRRSAEAAEAASRIREEGQAQADALREEAQADRDRVREDGEAAIEAARQQGREMVAEAQAVRERVLRDLAVRRKRARQQVEQLNAGRERLLQAYDLVRRTLDEATNELNVSLTDARIAADAAVRRIDEEPETTLEQLDAEVAAAGLADLPIAGIDHDHDEGPPSGEVPAVEEPAEAAAAPDEESETPSVQLDERRGRKSRRKKGFEGLPPSELTVVAPPSPDESVRVLPEEPARAEDTPAQEAPPPEGSAVVEAEAGTAEDVFARLRAEQQPEATDEPAEDAPTEEAPADEAPAGEASTEDPPAEAEATDEAPAAEAPSPEAAPFVARAEAVEPVEKELGRRLKRALADEQNEVLDLLRRAKPKGVDDLLPAADDHAARWADVVAATLAELADAGAAASGGTASSTADLADELARGLTAPLRERIDRSFAASDGNLDEIADRVRALYREWKGKRLTETTTHFAAAAYARGVFDAIEADAHVHWVIDPSEGACPDCDDNVLAGAITKGDDFPTGNTCAPAHPGCHCLVLAAAG